MEQTYFERAYQDSAKVRWVCKFLRYSGFIELEGLSSIINEKLARVDKRKGPLDDQAVSKITENLIWAKIGKKALDKRIRLYTPKIAKESPTTAFIEEELKHQTFTFEQSCGAIYKEKHFRMRTNPSILIPGFLPEGNEAFFLMRKCFLKYGSVYYVNYPIRNFYKKTVFHQFYDTILEINNRKLQNAGQSSSPFLVGTSFGGHMIVSFLKWLRANNLMESLDIKGIILISPVLCLDDLLDPELERQKTLIGRAVAHLLDAGDNDPEAILKNMQKAKSILVKMFTSGRDLLNFESKDLIPVFAIEDEVLSVFKQTADVDAGYFDRFLEMRNEKPIKKEFLSNIPTQVLFAEGEGDVMTTRSPTMSAFTDLDTLHTIFPNGSVEFVRSKSRKRKVTHSDLIFQADRFMEHVDPWLNRVVS